MITTLVSFSMAGEPKMIVYRHINYKFYFCHFKIQKFAPPTHKPEVSTFGQEECLHQNGLHSVRMCVDGPILLAMQPEMLTLLTISRSVCPTAMWLWETQLFRQVNNVELPLPLCSFGPCSASFALKSWDW